MAFLVSPGVQVKEIDLTNVIPATSASIGAIAGAFQWGPVDEVITVGSEKQLVNIFGQPNDDTFSYFMAAQQFLSYGNTLRVTRAVGALAKNAADNTSSPTLIKNDDHAETITNVACAAKYPGVIGSNISVDICTADSTVFDDWAFKDLFNAAPTTSSAVAAVGGSNDEMHVVVYDRTGAITGAANTVLETYEYVSQASDAYSSDGTSNYFKNVINSGSNWVRLLGNLANSHDDTFQTPATGTTDLEYTLTDGFIAAHGTDTFRVFVDGSELINDDTTSPPTVHWTALTDNTIVLAANPANDVEILIKHSKDVYANLGDTAQDSDGFGVNFDALVNETGTNELYTFELTDGVDANVLTLGELQLGFDKFSDAETIEISLIMNGNPMAGSDATAISNKIIAIADARKDCVAFVSPPITSTVNNASAVTKVIEWADSLTHTSYAFADSGALYVYDKYNDKYRWIAASGAMAGLAANADMVADPWFSPAGFTRGNLRNVTKIALNPNQSGRDDLYKRSVNPIVAFPGAGTVLYGDKTLQSKPSAFDRINVRRLFITLEKAISQASKASLFEFNDEFTRAQFRNMTEPFLRDIKGRRGITDFKVVCDDTNNTGDVIDTNRFVADIYIKPARSINFITLNFIATRTGVEFSEIAGGN